MRAYTSRHFNPQTRGTSFGKIRGTYVAPKNPNGSSTDGQWYQMWSTEWDWDFIKNNIDRSVDVGATSIKCDPAIDIYIEGDGRLQDVRRRIGMFMEYSIIKGLTVAWKIPQNEWYTTANRLYGSGSELKVPVVNSIKTFIRDVDKYPNVLHLDVLNEMNYHFTNNPTGAIDFASKFIPEVREVTDLPLTASLADFTASQIGEEWCDGLDPYIDFHDYHFYGANLDFSAMLTKYKAQYYGYKPFMVGELGSLSNGGASQLATNLISAQTIVNDPLCMGVFIFPITKYDPPGADYYPGFYDDNETLSANADVIRDFKKLPAGY